MIEGTDFEATTSKAAPKKSFNSDHQDRLTAKDSQGNTPIKSLKNIWGVVGLALRVCVKLITWGGGSCRAITPPTIDRLRLCPGDHGLRLELHSGCCRDGTRRRRSGVVNAPRPRGWVHPGSCAQVSRDYCSCCCCCQRGSVERCCALEPARTFGDKRENV